MYLTLCIIEIIVALGISFYIFPLAKVNGRSMLPTFKDGSLLLTTRLFNRDKLKIGDIYVYKRINEDGQEIAVVKRLTNITSLPYEDYDNLLFFEGDNPEESYDSRHYGFINAEDIIAKVLWQVRK